MDVSTTLVNKIQNIASSLSAQSKPMAKSYASGLQRPISALHKPDSPLSPMDSRGKQKAVCRLYLRNNYCPWGDICRHFHVPLPPRFTSSPKDLKASIQPANTPVPLTVPNHTLPSDKTSPSNMKDSEICLRGRCKNDKTCHPEPTKSHPLQESSKTESDTSPIQQDEPSLAVEHEVHLRWLIDTFCASANPMVAVMKLPDKRRPCKKRKKLETDKSPSGWRVKDAVTSGILDSDLVTCNLPIEIYSFSSPIQVRLPPSLTQRPNPTVDSPSLKYDSCNSSWWRDDESDLPRTSITFAEQKVDKDLDLAPEEWDCVNASWWVGEDSISSQSSISDSHIENSASQSSGLRAMLHKSEEKGAKRIVTPPFETCWDWLAGRCLYGQLCKYDHSRVNGRSKVTPDLVPQVLAGRNPPHEHSGADKWVSSRERAHISSRPPMPCSHVPEPPDLNITVLDYTKVKLGAGFEIHEVTTGFESRWILMTRVPSTVSEDEMRDILDRFGRVLSIRLPGNSMTAKIQFANPSQALQAAASLNGSRLFGQKVAVRLPVNNTRNGTGVLHDTCVHLSWNAPARVGYAGYVTISDAEAAVTAASSRLLQGTPITASIYEGVPALGSFNVRFEGLPPSATTKVLERFARPECTMLGKPNYPSLDNAIKTIRSLLEQAGELVDFEVPPAPYRDGKVRASAYFVSRDGAEQAYAALNNRRMRFLGMEPIFARHQKYVSYTLPVEVYDRVASDIEFLRHTAWRNDRGVSISVFDGRPQADASPVRVKISGRSTREMGYLKSAFEKILHGEILRQNGKVAWDEFFRHPASENYLREVEQQNAGISIQRNLGRRTITMFGSLDKRNTVRSLLLEKISHLQRQQVRTIPLSGAIMAPLFMSADLMKLQHELGPENVILDLRNRRLVIRGAEPAYETAQQAVHRTKQKCNLNRNHDFEECPVCLGEICNPVTLRCGHQWCKSCLAHYLIATTDNKVFPLTCFGAKGTCSQPIALATAEEVLSSNEFEAVVHAAFFAYIHSHPGEFHHCPTADCPQVYREPPRDAVLQCPSCLTRICPNCNCEYHEGTDCDSDDEELFLEWVEKHDVKSCPGCKAPIERNEGCNHITCAQCRTHICWVCTETFPKGEGIYQHMRSQHGGIGI